MSDDECILIKLGSENDPTRPPCGGLPIYCSEHYLDQSRKLEKEIENVRVLNQEIDRLRDIEEDRRLLRLEVEKLKADALREFGKLAAVTGMLEVARAQVDALLEAAKFADDSLEKHRPGSRDKVVEAAQRVLKDVLDRIERGVIPPTVSRYGVKCDKFGIHSTWAKHEEAQQVAKEQDVVQRGSCGPHGVVILDTSAAPKQIVDTSPLPKQITPVEFAAGVGVERRDCLHLYTTQVGPHASVCRDCGVPVNV